ncbi:hypothetical protein TCSYLVIO_005965, partial [Trypanosoma cruzi]
MIFYHTHAATITRRATSTRLTTPHDERTIQLQQVNVPVLNPERISGRLNPATLERLMQVWGLVGRPPFPPSSFGKARGGSRRIPIADARLLRKAGIIEDGSSTITGGWIIPFSVVEEKTTGLRRWIAWPRDKNRDDPYEANVPLLHISHYLSPVISGTASCLDLKAPFFQVSLPRETRHLFRCCVEDGTLVELTRLPMGYKTSPEILQIIITSAIAGVTTVVHRLWAAPPSVRVDVWIDNIRIAGSKSGVTSWEAQAPRNADDRHATMGGRQIGRHAVRLLGAQFDHTHRAVSLSERFVRFVCAMPLLKYLTIAEMDVMASRFLYAAAILCTRLFDYLFFIKAVRRRLSALNRGIVLETSPANL